VNKTMSANQPKSVPSAPGAPQYIKYTPAKQGPEYNSGAAHRIIKMHEVAVDPMQPPKFVHKKVRSRSGSVRAQALTPHLRRCPAAPARHPCL
jgi:SNW domain-containing protein 1